MYLVLLSKVLTFCSTLKLLNPYYVVVGYQYQPDALKNISDKITNLLILDFKVGSYPLFLANKNGIKPSNTSIKLFNLYSTYINLLLARFSFKSFETTFSRFSVEILHDKNIRFSLTHKIEDVFEE